MLRGLFCVEIVLGTGASSDGVSRYPGLIRRQQLPSYNLQKVFVCLFCLFCFVGLKYLAGAVFSLGTARKRALVSEYLVEGGFIEVVLLSFKTCHVGDANKNFVAIFW
jgi:hypothetical protein